MPLLSPVLFAGPLQSKNMSR